MGELRGAFAQNYVFKNAPNLDVEPVIATPDTWAGVANAECPTKQAIANYYASTPDGFVPSFLNAWTTSGGAVAYYRAVGGKVIHLLGPVQRVNPTIGSIMFNLPAGFRPPITVVAACSSNNTGGFAAIAIDTGGDVSWQSASISGTIITNLNLIFLAS